MQQVTLPFHVTGDARLQHALAEWLGLYENRSYMLARLAIQGVTESHPNLPEGWLLLGLTELAVRDPRRATEALRKAKEALKRRGPTLGPDFSGMERLLPPLLEALDRRVLSAGPEPWNAWLLDPASVGSTKSLLEQMAATPLGRTAPLAPMSNDPLGSYKAKGALAESLPDIRVTVDTMRGLLGRDADLHFKPEHISLIDPSIHIRTVQPVEPLATSTAAAAAARAAMPPPAPVAPPTRPSAPAAPKASTAQAPAFPFKPSAPPTPARSAAPAPPAPTPAPQPARQEAMKSLAGALGGAAAGMAAAAAAAKGATKGAQDAAASQPENPWVAWEQKVEELLERGQHSEALMRIREAVERYPQSSRLHEIQARALGKLGRRQEALKAWTETFRQAKAAGADDRAERAYREAFDLAKENGDLLLDLAGLAAALGAAGMAVTTGKLAADLYRRRNDRPKLVAALRRLREWHPLDAGLASELQRLEGEPVTPAARAVTNVEPWGGQVLLGREPGGTTEVVGREEAYGRVPAPKRVGRGDSAPIEFDALGRARPPAAPRPVVPHNPGPGGPNMEQLRQRAMQVKIAGRSEASSGREDGSLGIALLVGSIIVLFLSMGLGSVIPAIAGFLVTNGVTEQTEKAAGAEGDPQLKLMKASRVICGVAFFLGLIL